MHARLDRLLTIPFQQRLTDEQRLFTDPESTYAPEVSMLETRVLFPILGVVYYVISLNVYLIILCHYF